MKCKICGNNNLDDSMFCTECGSYLKNQDVIVSEYKTDSNENNENVKPVDQENSNDNNKNAEISAANSENNKSTDEKPSLISSDDAKNIVSENAEKSNQNQKTENTADVANSESTEDKQHVKVGAGRIFGASVISFFAIIFLIILGLLLSAKIGFNGNVLKKRTENANMNAVLDSYFDDDTTASDFIYNNIGSAILGRKGIKSKDLRSFLIKSNFEKFTGGIVYDYANYIIDGIGEEPSADSNDFVQFLKENEDVAREEFINTFSETEYKNIAVRLKNRGFDDALSIDAWGKEIGFDLMNTRHIFSYITIGILFAVILFMFVWIAIIVDKKGKHLTGFYGNIMLISGLVLFIPSVVFLIASPAFALSTNNLFAFLAMELLVPFALIMLCTGAFEIIVGFILKRIKKFIKKKCSDK